MSNLEILDNVMHRGIVLKKGIVVTDEHQGLKSVAQDLIARGLAKESDKSATHTIALVTGSQEAIPVGSTEGGQTPNAQNDDTQKANAKARQEAASGRTQAEIEGQADKEAEIVTAKPATADNKPQTTDPTNEEIAAAAAAAA